MKAFLMLLIMLGFMISCKPSQEKLSEKEQLLNVLKAVKGKGILFGHQDTYAYGVTWNDIEGNSDVKRVTGDYPAVFGWELGGIEKGVKANLDTV